MWGPFPQLAPVEWGLRPLPLQQTCGEISGVDMVCGSMRKWLKCSVMIPAAIFERHSSGYGGGNWGNDR